MKSALSSVSLALFLAPDCQPFAPVRNVINGKAGCGSNSCLTMTSTASDEHIQTGATSNKSCGKCRRSKRLYSFNEARKIARGHGFSSKQEFYDYDCAGAYQLPKDADVVWKDDWRGWDDFLGVPLTFKEVSASALFSDMLSICCNF